jgi:hypothetical protein
MLDDNLLMKLDSSGVCSLPPLAPAGHGLGDALMAGGWRVSFIMFLVVLLGLTPLAPAMAFAESMDPGEPPFITHLGQENDHLGGDFLNPADGVNQIEPPEASQTGDANLELPIDLPPGRLGMQPDLALTYDSGGDNGWLGLGWDLALPEIAVEDRWGVPRYSAAQETETYLLNGTQLAPIAHRGDFVEREAIRIS